ncbi:MAG: hypothetical protein M5U08_19765 [Burkholderiales bacterium]|nr:hypothetical protein [Burkholderiales bacterium]
MFDFLAARDAAAAVEAVAVIVNAIAVLERHPHIGRPVQGPCASWSSPTVAQATLPCIACHRVATAARFSPCGTSARRAASWWPVDSG